MLDALRTGGKRALAAALAEVEARPDAPETAALLDAAFAAPHGLALGLTGPPGAGKSTLVDALIRHWRPAGGADTTAGATTAATTGAATGARMGARTRARTVGVIAVDPSSAASGGALLGDRTRLTVDPADPGVFVRSMAARDRLGGLAAAAFPAMVLMRALYDLVIVETVGVGQSETAVAGVADLVVLCVPPGAGDTLQHMKAGVLEVPDVVAVTKADLGAAAARTRAELTAALSLGCRAAPVVACSAATGEGLAALAAAIDAAAARLAPADQRHRVQADRWAEQQIASRFGWEGLQRLRQRCGNMLSDEPFTAVQKIQLRLSAAFGNAFG
jgi:LAO/AO transport system kinase